MAEDSKEQYDRDSSEYFDLDQNESIIELESLPQLTNRSQQLGEHFLVDDNANKKSTCQYCKRQFSHPGSLGRHLDLKKGDERHPLEEVNGLRSGVKRRNTGLVEKEQKSRAKKPKLVVMNIEKASERNRVRRKLRDRRIKSKILASEEFVSRFGRRSGPVENFAQLVALMLPAAKYPHPFPEEETLDALLAEFRLKVAPSSQTGQTHSSEEQCVSLAKQLYEQWHPISENEKQRIWAHELTTTLSAVMGPHSLDNLQNISMILAERENAVFKEICEKDGLLDYLHLPSDIQDHDNTE